MTINLGKAVMFIRRLLPQAGEILLNYFGSADLDVQKKGKTDIVTEADLKVDRFLQTEIKKAYPKIPFLTEETAPHDFSNLEKEEFLWVIDPLDGTVNFSRGYPHFAISIGLINKGLVKLGVVYAPTTGDIYWVQDGINGAFLNNKRLRVSTINDMAKTTFLCDWVLKPKPRAVMIRYLKKITPCVRQIKSQGSAVLDIVSLAEGKADIYLNPGLKPWDLAASTFIVQKAGGTITTPEGERWNIFNPNALITNGRLHNKVLGIINFSNN